MIPGQGGGQGWGGEGVGRKGRGAPAGDRGKGTEPHSRSAPPSPLRTLRSNQEEQEEEEDEQNGRRHQPGRKRCKAQARPARSLLRPVATACPAKVVERTESLAKEYTLTLDTTHHVVVVGLVA